MRKTHPRSAPLVRAYGVARPRVAQEMAAAPSISRVDASTARGALDVPVRGNSAAATVVGEAVVGVVCGTTTGSVAAITVMVTLAVSHGATTCAASATVSTDSSGTEHSL